MSSRDQILEQLLKLQTLAQRAAGTPEGAVARRKLRELLQRHGLTLKDLRPTSAAHVHHEVTPPSTSASTPVVLTLKIGGVRIRWRL